MRRTFPSGFRWGVASSGHQTEGGNTQSDTWFLEHVRPTVFREPSGQACDSYARWREDVDLVVALGLDTYRFSVEWARVEPAEGEFSAPDLAHYRAIVDHCLASVRDRKRAEVYGRWLRLARDDDFVGVQNYELAQYDGAGPVPPPPGAMRNQVGWHVHPRSLAGAVRYAHEATGVPVFVTEHGLAELDDGHRAAFLSPALAGLLDAIEDGVPVLGYLHWTLLDNFEWIFGYDVRFGLHEVDRETFARRQAERGRCAANARATTRSAAG